MTGLTSHRPIHRLRIAGRTAVAVGAILTIAAFLLPGFAPSAEAEPEDKCTQYYFLYTDGHTDQGEVCDGPVNELHSGTHGIHVPNLHISCSDAFDVAIMEDDEIVGWDSDGNSELGDHLIADIGGVAQWGVRKSWTGGDDCGLVAPPPPSDPADPAAGLAFDCTAGLSLLATNEGGEDADLTVLQGATVIDTITVPKNTTTETAYLVDGENITEDGSADFTVKFGDETLVDAQTVEKNCETPTVVTVPDPTPSVDVEKLVSLDGTTYDDADTAPGPGFQLALNDPAQDVWFRVVVTNTSDDGTVLTLNSLTDDVTAGDAGELNLTGCTFPAGGLPDGESVTCDLGPFDAEEGAQHTNTVTVSASGGDQTVGDSDPANYAGTRVGGVVVERPPAPAAPVDPPVGEPEPAPEVKPAPEVLAEELPRTGPEDLWLAGLALMLLGAGLLTIARGKAMDAAAYATGTWWTRRTP